MHCLDLVRKKCVAKIGKYVLIFFNNSKKMDRPQVLCNKKLEKLIRNNTDVKRNQKMFSRSVAFLWLIQYAHQVRDCRKLAR
jgi:hypothetical protein